MSVDEAQRVKASADWSRMSPILAEKVPEGRYVADAVVRPATGRDVAAVLRVAYEHDVPVTPRGAGTGNYGQATPFDRGILLDLRGLTDVRIGTDTVTAGAGARLSAIDKELRAADREIALRIVTVTGDAFLTGDDVDALLAQPDVMSDLVSHARDLSFCPDTGRLCRFADRIGAACRANAPL